MTLVRFEPPETFSLLANHYHWINYRYIIIILMKSIKRGIRNEFIIYLVKDKNLKIQHIFLKLLTKKSVFNAKKVIVLVFIGCLLFKSLSVRRGTEVQIVKNIISYFNIYSQ